MHEEKPDKMSLSKEEYKAKVQSVLKEVEEERLIRAIQKCVTSPIHNNGMSNTYEEEDYSSDSEEWDKENKPHRFNAASYISKSNQVNQEAQTTPSTDLPLESPFVTAAKIGNFERLLRMKQDAQFPIAGADIDEAICEASRNNHLRVLSWLSNHYGLCSDRQVPMIFAAVRGHAQIFEFLCSAGYVPTSFVMSYVAQYGRVEFLPIAKMYGYQDWSHTGYSALKFEQLDCLRYCLQQISTQDNNDELRLFLNFMMEGFN